MANESPFSFRRPDLALHYCDSLEGKGLLDGRSGLFLAAPRRTGKSTFLREDLVPALNNRGWATVYIDLWSDKACDPALLIRRAIKAKLGTCAGAIAKLARAAGLEKVNVFGALSLNLSALDLPAELTLADALEALSAAAQSQVAIIVDEAQHALTSQAGVDAMFALKAARDHMNQGLGSQRLALVLTGSNRDKLAHLLLKRSQPFYGSDVTRFPLLGKDFSDAYTDFVNPQLAATNQFDPDAVFEAFRIIGHRPEVLRKIVADLALNAGARHLGDALKNDAEEIKARMWAVMESEFSELPSLQRAVLEVIISEGAGYAPFSEASMRSYTALMEQEKPSTSAVQAALDALREKELVWRAAYGAYALEDESMALWYQNRR